AAAWAVMNHLGEAGYMDIARQLAAMTDAYVAGIKAIDGLHLWAEPDLTIINFGAYDLDIFNAAEGMERRGWLPGLTRNPKGMQAMLSMYHEAGREDYLADLAASVQEAQEQGGGSDLKAVY
ncbi:MAG: aspartate aminotransferase family protein, partial [Alphaproteobacteria bacterium]|nr:aspartate aminotransferase family protein [Alphaproteobacteria bacterium]